MSETRVITGKVMFSYAQVFEPVAMNEGGKEKYSVSIIIPKKDKETISKIKKAIKAALEEGKHLFNGKAPKVFKDPLRDGDEERPDNEAYENSMFVNAKSDFKPGIVDKNLDEIISKDDFYSGCFGRASLNFYAYNVNGNKGIACGLNNLQKLEDGERLDGGGMSAKEEFSSFEMEDEDLLD